MPQRGSPPDDQTQPWLNGYLRGRTRQIVADAVRDVTPVLEESWSLDVDAAEAGIEAYVTALVEAVETQSFEPLERYLASLDSLWHAEYFALDPLIRSIFLICDITSGYLPDHCRDSALATVQSHTREAITFLSRRSVTLVTSRLEEQVARHREGEARLMSLQRVGAALVSDLDLERALSLIAEEAQRLIGADGIGIRLAAEDGGLEFIGGSGDESQLLRTRRLSIESSLSGVALRSGAPVRVNDTSTDPRVDLEYRSSSGGRSLMIVPLIARDEPIGVVAGTSARLNAFDEQDESILTLFADQAAAAIQNGRLYQQAQEHIAELESLHRVSQLVSSSLDLNEIFQTLYDEVVQLMPADVLLVALARPDGLYDFEFIVDDGQRYPPSRGVELSPLLSDPLRNREMVIVRDLSQHEYYDQVTRFGNVDRESRSILAAPLLRGNQVIGMLSVQSYTEYDYRDPESRLLRTIASQAAVAIEHARLYRQAQNVAVAEERARLAREIHDTLAQGLIGVILCLERLDLTVPEDDTCYRPWIERSLQLSRSSLEEARRSVRDLRAAPLEGRSLLEAVANLVADHNEEGEFLISSRLPPTLPPLSARVETALFRVVQEATSNAQKHARCQVMTLEIESDGQTLWLRMGDDGVGFVPDLNAASSEHYGLTTMRERVHQVGGEIEIESTQGEGTAITVALPVDLAIYQESRDPGKLPDD